MNRYKVKTEVSIECSALSPEQAKEMAAKAIGGINYGSMYVFALEPMYKAGDIFINESNGILFKLSDTCHCIHIIKMTQGVNFVGVINNKTEATLQEINEAWGGYPRMQSLKPITWDQYYTNFVVPFLRNYKVHEQNCTLDEPLTLLQVMRILAYSSSLESKELLKSVIVFL